MASDSERRKFFEAPEAPSEVTFRGIKMFFYCNFSTKATLANCNKASINNGWSSCNFRGPFTGPLEPLKTDVSRGPPGLSGGPGPLGPQRNSTTGKTDTPRARKPHTTYWIWRDFFSLYFFIYCPSRFEVDLSRFFSKSSEVKFPPSRRLKSTWRHSKSKSGRITLGRVTPRSSTRWSPFAHCK